MEIIKNAKDKEDENEEDEETRIVRKVTEYILSKDEPICGSDNIGNEYESIEKMWRSIEILPSKENNNKPSNKHDSSANSSPKNTQVTKQQSSIDEDEFYWYENAYDFWEETSETNPTIDGMLGGFASISDIDLKGSQSFLQHVLSITHHTGDDSEDDGNNVVPLSCCDCGAGIGRITKGLFIPMNKYNSENNNGGTNTNNTAPLFFHVNSITMVESSPGLLLAAADSLGNLISDSTTTTSKIENKNISVLLHNKPKCHFICQGLQEYHPKPNSFDVIWIQWVIGYLTDKDCVHFLKRCAKALRHETKTNNISEEDNEGENNNKNSGRGGGIIILKDNTANHKVEAIQLDMEDSSVTRSLSYLLSLADQAGLKVIHQTYQDDFPSEIFPVPMIAFQVK